MAVQAALAALVGVGVSWPLVDPRRLVAGFDTVAYTVPNQAVAFAAIRAGRLASWNPFAFAGTPHLANPQVGFFYPLKLPFAWLEPHRAVMLVTALHLALLGAGVVVLLGGSLRLRPPAPLVGGIAMVACGATLGQTLHFEQILAIAIGPWVLAAVDAASTARVRARPAAALVATATTLMLLAGHLQPAYYLLAMIVPWGLVRIWTSTPDWRPRAERAAAVLGGLALGAGAAAVQLVPTARLVSRSVRAGGIPLRDQFATNWFVPFHSLATVLLGDVRQQWFEGTAAEITAYVGAAGIALAVVGALAGLVRPERRVVAGLAVASVVGGVLLASGSPAYRLLYRVVPGLSQLRVTSRWVVVVDLSLAILAALGVDAVVRGVAGRRELIAVGVAAAALLIGVAGPLDGPRAPGELLWLGAAGAVVLCCAAVHYDFYKGAAVLMLVLVPLAELAWLSSRAPARVLVAPNWEQTLPADKALDFLSRRPERTLALGGHRLFDARYVVASLNPNANASRGIRSIDGYDGGAAVTKQWARAMEAFSDKAFNADLTLRGQIHAPLDGELLGRFGVRWVLLDTDVFPAALWVPGWDGPGVTEDLASAKFVVFENPSYVSEAFLYRRTQTARARPGLELRALSRAGTATALVQDGPVLTCATKCERTELPLVRVGDDRIEVNAGATTTTLLVVAEQFDPGWRVLLDGRRVRPRVADGMLLGVRLPAGEHRVVMAYRPEGLAAGEAVTTLALIGIVVCALLPRRRQAPPVSLAA